MMSVKITKATTSELENHYKHAVAMRLKFDKIRPNYYKNKITGTKNNPMMEHYRQWLLKQELRFIGVEDVNISL